MRRPAYTARRGLGACLLLALLGALGGCGSAGHGGAARTAASRPCAETVLGTLSSILQRVYREGVSSERTASAAAMIEHSAQLRSAAETGDAAEAGAAARALLATGHMTNLAVRARGTVLVDAGQGAMAPLSGQIKGRGGTPVATYTTSVWSYEGFSAEASGIAEGLIDLRSGDRSVGGTIALPAGPLPPQGTLSHGGVTYRYASFPATAYPSGPLRIYLLKTAATVAPMCAGSEEDTQVATLTRVAHLIYEGEAGARTLVQIHRVQRNAPLLAAVAARNPAATMRAVAALLHQHIVRLRVSAGGTLLADDGGPFVLAPVVAPLRLHGRTIGSFVLSIQDDEGYLRLARRLAGLDVLMYMAPTTAGGAPRLVKNSLGPDPGTVPASGGYTYRGRRFRVITIHASAFPSGPLTIRVLMPMPYG